RVDADGPDSDLARLARDHRRIRGKRFAQLLRRRRGRRNRREHQHARDRTERRHIHSFSVVLPYRATGRSLEPDYRWNRRELPAGSRNRTVMPRLLSNEDERTHGRTGRTIASGRLIQRISAHLRQVVVDRAVGDEPLALAALLDPHGSGTRDRPAY